MTNFASLLNTYLLKPLAERKLLFCDQHSVGSHVEELLSSLSSQFFDVIVFLSSVVTCQYL